jgi:hypothetical protein
MGWQNWSRRFASSMASFEKTFVSFQEGEYNSLTRSKYGKG